MLGIVDYASSGDESGEEMDLEPSKTSLSSKSRILNLPPVIKNPVIKKRKDLVDKDEDIPEVLAKRDWEKELAEATRKDMKFVKQNKNFVTKKKILAFGLNFKDVNEDDDEDLPVITSQSTSESKPNFKSGLLNILPKPKNPVKKPENNVKAASVLLPSSIISKKAAKRPLHEEDDMPGTSKLQVEVVERESDEEDNDEDFFGFNSAKPILPVQIPDQLPSKALSEGKIFMDEVAPGPARPSQGEPAFKSTRDLEAALLGKRNINDQQAEALIYQRELAPWGANDRDAREAVMNIVDVSVDEELGPNVRETLLRNLDQKTVVAGPLPNIKAGDRVSKQKHQITHLAKLAVARESQLQQQWADSKAKKRATANKYGF